MRVLLLTNPTDAISADETAMHHYHEQLRQAGVLLAGDPTAGFWLLEVDSPEEATEWARRLPCDVEIREVADHR